MFRPCQEAAGFTLPPNDGCGGRSLFVSAAWPSFTLPTCSPVGPFP